MEGAFPGGRAAVHFGKHGRRQEKAIAPKAGFARTSCSVQGSEWKRRSSSIDALSGRETSGGREGQEARRGGCGSEAKSARPGGSAPARTRRGTGKEAGGRPGEEARTRGRRIKEEDRGGSKKAIAGGGRQEEGSGRPGGSIDPSVARIDCEPPAEPDCGQESGRRAGPLGDQGLTAEAR